MLDFLVGVGFVAANIGFSTSNGATSDVVGATAEVFASHDLTLALVSGVTLDPGI